MDAMTTTSGQRWLALRRRLADAHDDVEVLVGPLTTRRGGRRYLDPSDDERTGAATSTLPKRMQTRCAHAVSVVRLLS